MIANEARNCEFLCGIIFVVVVSLMHVDKNLKIYIVQYEFIFFSWVDALFFFVRMIIFRRVRVIVSSLFNFSTLSWTLTVKNER